MRRHLVLLHRRGCSSNVFMTFVHPSMDKVCVDDMLDCVMWQHPLIYSVGIVVRRFPVDSEKQGLGRGLYG